MRYLNRIVVAPMTGLVLLLSSSWASLALAQANPKPSSSVDLASAPQQSSSTDPMYQAAKAELPEDYYLIYRIVERLARANGLDDLPWRVYIAPEYDLTLPDLKVRGFLVQRVHLS
jgi:hypothetical protein